MKNQNDKEPKYWVLVAKPNVWNIKAAKNGDSETYDCSKYQNAFKKAKEGERAIGYASGVSEVVGLFKIISKESDYQLGVEKVGNLKKPITLGEINAKFKEKNFPKKFSYMQRFREITEEQYNCIIEMIPKNGLELLDGSVKKIISKNQIFYGPPGTGKTRKAKLEAAKITGISCDTENEIVKEVEDEIEKEKGIIKLVQFHPSYSYFDFVEGIEVRKDGFKLRDKVFKAFAESAAKDKNNNYVLIIDEINRANIASVFGELLYALEYRGKTINTSLGELTVPDNLYIIGTMNTADVLVSEIDYAVRRRFDFKKVFSKFPNGNFRLTNKTRELNDIEYSVCEDYIKVKGQKYNFSDWNYDDNDNIGSYKVDEKWFISNLYNRVRIDITKSVARGVNVEDIMPGVSYFLVNNAENSENGTCNPDPEHLQYKIDYEIIPLLIEYAKNGLFSKRNKIYKDKSLYELLLNMEYAERLKDWLKEKGYTDGSSGDNS